MKLATSLALLLLAFAAAADARGLLQGAKVKCTAGCLPGSCAPGGKKCLACADGYVLKQSSGQCACPDGSGSWADQTYEVVDFPASAPNCGVLPATSCKCQPCPPGYAQTGAGSIPDSVCRHVPVDCVGVYDDFPAECVSKTCLTTVTQVANLLEITTAAKYGGQECPLTKTQQCTDDTPAVDCTPANVCQVSTCLEDGTCSEPTNVDDGSDCDAAGAPGICTAGACVKTVNCQGEYVRIEGATCRLAAGTCSGQADAAYTIITPSAGGGQECDTEAGTPGTVACNAPDSDPCNTDDLQPGTCTSGTCGVVAP